MNAKIDTFALLEQVMVFGWIRCSRLEASALLMDRGIPYKGNVYTLSRIENLGAGVYEIHKEDYTRHYRRTYY